MILFKNEIIENIEEYRELLIRESKEENQR